MSLDYVEIELDRPRRMRFSFRDLRDLENRLGGIPFQEVLNRLQAMHLNTLVQTIHIGLRGEDPRMTVARVEEIIEEYLGKGRPLADLLSAVAEAMELSGITGRAPITGREDDRPT